VALPLVKVTVPVGVPATVNATVAERVTDWPGFALVGLTQGAVILTADVIVAEVPMAICRLAEALEA
jgi:hypothetical protein